MTINREQFAEYIWKLVSLLALPALAWAFSLNSDRVSLKLEQEQIRRRVEILETQIDKTTNSLNKIGDTLTRLSVSADYMANELERLRNRQ